MTDAILPVTAEGDKPCPKCGKTKPLCEFQLYGKAEDGRQGYCRRCMNSYGRKAKLRRRYGLEEADYDALLAQQGGICAVCGASPNGVGLCVDHDHASGFIRGLLCRPCNTAIGYFERMVPALPKVLAYLMSPPALEMNGRRVKNPEAR